MDNPTEPYASFSHECSLYTVRPNGTAYSWHAEFVRRDDGKWMRSDGSYLKPSLQSAFQEAYKSLMGQVQP